jgi:hypothetical protein
LVSYEHFTPGMPIICVVREAFRVDTDVQIKRAEDKQVAQAKYSA